MRLKPAQVQVFCQKVLHTLRAKQLITLIKPEVEIIKKMEEICLKELRVEDDINREAEQILAQYTAKMGESIDKQKMFQLIKKQLVKDKKVVL